MSQPTMFYQWIFQSADNVITAYVTATAARVIHAIGPLAVTLFGIYVVLWGLSHLQNKIEEPVTDGAIRMIKVAFVLGFALNIGYYSDYIIKFCQDTPVALAAVVSQSNTPTTEQSTAQQLDAMLDKGFALGNRAKAKAGVLNGDFGMYIVALVCYLGTAVLTLFAAVMLMLSKFALAVLLAIGPIFLLLCLFQATKQFFGMWLGQVINFILTYVLSIAVISLVFGFIEDFLTQAVAQPDVSSFASMVQLFIMCGIGVLVLRQVPSVASALGGGIAMSTLGAFGASMRSAGRTGRVAGKVGGRAAAAGGRLAWNSRAGVAVRERTGQLFRRKNSIAMG
jgi:type IV secretion system protein VirB6